MTEPGESREADGDGGFEHVIRFLYDCYRADNREQALLDVFAKKVEARIGIAEVTGFAAPGLGTEPRLEIAGTKDLRTLARTAQLMKAEKKLQLGAVFVAGRLPEAEGYRKICAPLFFAPLSWDEATDCLRVELDQWRLNEPLVAAVARVAELSPTDSEGWPSSWPAPPYAPDVLMTAGRQWAERVPGMECRLPTESFESLDETALRRQRNVRGEKHTALTISWSQMVLLVRRSVDSRGVLSELERLVDETPSAPLSALLGNRGASKPSEGTSAEAALAPAILSQAQHQVVHNAVEKTLSLVVGPPGTGKSFTIAAIALDALSRGRSVLVASKMNHAVDVIGNKLEAMLQLDDFAVRGGRREYSRELKQRLERWLSGVLPVPEGDNAFFQDLTEALQQSQTLDSSDGGGNALTFLENSLFRRLVDQEALLEELAAELQERSDDEMRFGLLAVGQPAARWWQRLRDRWYKNALTKKLEKPPAYWHLMESYREGQEERLQLLTHLLQARFLKRLLRVLQQERLELTRLRDAVRARTVNRRENLWEKIDASVLLEALPVWLVNLSDIASILPFERQMFDVVIIDEATQCDIASCLPLLQRAKRAIIVGDPRQLRHLSFLPRSRQESLGERHGLSGEELSLFDYRDRSILDVADSVLPQQDAIVFLDEHFRSAPSIIGFSNREFYNRRLRVMQESPAHDWHRALYLHQTAGRRNEAGANTEEADALISRLRGLIAQQADRPTDLRQSLGVLSPFRSQVDLLTERLAAELPVDIAERHDVLVGTAHAFQGEERDVMFLSLVLDAESHPSAYRFLERPDVFNVSITRARSIQHVFTSMAPGDLRGDGLLSRFLRHMSQDRSSPAKAPIGDSFANQVASRLRLEDCRVWSPYAVAGFEVDMVIERRGACLGIDLVGYPGKLAGSFELERYRLFNRAGLRLTPIPYSAWLADPGACIEAVLQILDS